MSEDHDDKRMKLDLKLMLRPVFNAFCDYVKLYKEVFDELFSATGLDPYNEREHPISIQEIRETFEKATYADVLEFADDCNQITSKLKEKDINGKNQNLHLEIASQLDLYIKRTIIPILSAKGILRLYQSPNIQLDKNNELSDDDSTTFDYLNKLDRTMMFLRWPFPTVTHEIDWDRRATASLSNQYMIPKMRPGKELSNELSNELSIELNTRLVKTFRLDGTLHEVGITPDSQLPMYNVYITKENNLDPRQFVAEYVDKYLNSTDFSKVQLRKVDIPGSAAQAWVNSVQTEGEVEVALNKCLYRIIDPFVKHSLDEHKSKVSDNLKEIITERCYVKALSKKSPKEAIKTTVSSQLKAAGRLRDVEERFYHLREQPKDSRKDELESMFQQATLGSEFLGRNFTSDLDAGYKAKFEEPSKVLPIFYSTLGETKYPTFELGNCLEKLKDYQNNEIPFFEDESKPLIAEVERTLYKYASQCVRCGVPKFVLTDLTGFLFVKLQFQNETAREGYGTLEPEGVQYIKAQYTYFSKEESYIRLYFLSFFSMSETYMEEITNFRLLVSKELKAAQISAKSTQLQKQKGSTSGAGSGSGTGNDILLSKSDHDNSIKISTPPESSSSDSHSVSNGSLYSHKSHSNQFLKYDKTLFKWVAYIELGDVITDLIETGLRAAQVVKVDSAAFIKLVAEENVFVHGVIPKLSVLKVYDASLGQLLAYDEEEDEIVPVSYTYEDGTNYAATEAKAYCLLSEFCGDFMPHIYSYGRLSDLYPYIDPLYLKLSGAFLLIEFWEDDPDFKITKSFYEETIVPLFEKMHSRNVIHNDIKRSNVIITKDGAFKLIDFGHSRFSSSDLDKKAEMEAVFDHFGHSGRRYLR